MNCKTLLMWAVMLPSIVFGGRIYAADVVEVLAVTDTIIAVHFDDGIVKYGISGNPDQSFVSPLDRDKALKESAYRLISPDDPAYADFLNPLDLGYKSKPTEISGVCNWVPDPNGVNFCDNVYAAEHWVYLILPHALRPGKTYTLWLGGLAQNLQEYTFVFDETSFRSLAVHVSNVGYAPEAPLKFGYVGHWMGDKGGLDLSAYAGAPCSLYNLQTKTTHPIGSLQKRRAMNESQRDFNSTAQWGNFNSFFGGDVYECDFSSFTTPGEYVLVVEGVGCSYPFKIADDIYREAYYLTTRGLYHQRAGIELEKPYTDWTRPRDHHPADGRIIKYTTVKGNKMLDKTLFDATVAGAGEELPNAWGWYHDAGDWDAYLHHATVPFYLFALYELKSENFSDLELNIPQFRNGVLLPYGTGNGLPDVLDEAAWLVEHYRRNIRPNGGVCGGRIHGDMVKNESGMSSDDHRIFYAGAEDPHISFLFAGLAATYAWNLEKAGVSDSSQKLLVQARNAYTWAKNNITADDLTIEVDGMGVYDLQLYAAVCLFKYTGEQAFFDDIVARNKITSPTTALSGSDYKQHWAAWMYTTIPDNRLTIEGALALKSTMVSAVIADSKKVFTDNAQKRTTRVGYDLFMPPIVGSTTTPTVLPAMFAWNVAAGSDKEDILQYIYTTCDYFLGGNPLNITWITGYGDYHPTQMLHIDSRNDAIEEHVPGLVPYGPTLRPASGYIPRGPWEASFPQVRSYPDLFSWPISEMFFDTRYGVMDGEFTIHQTNVLAAAAYGFLCEPGHDFEPNAKPSVALSGVASGATFDEKDTLKLHFDVSDDEWVHKVQVFLDHHKVGECMAPDFDIMIPAVKLMQGNFSLNARAIDNEGASASSVGIPISIERNYGSTFISPASGSQFDEGQLVTAQVSVADFEPTDISHVEFYRNGELIASDNDGAPYQCETPMLARDNHLLAKIWFTEGFYSEAAVSVYASPTVKAVELNQTSFSLNAGEYYTLSANVLPEDAENKVVSWQSSDESIATVNSDGFIEFIKSGTVQIWVETAEGGYTESCTFDVKPSLPAGPRTGTPWLVPGKIEAEAFDNGGEGIAYHDITPGNQKAVYRFDGVDIEQTWDGSTAFALTNVEADEWVNYTVYIGETNFYDFKFRITAGMEGAALRIKLDGEDMSGLLPLPVVGWYPLKDHIVNNIYLKEGLHTLQLEFAQGPFTLNYIDITCASCTAVLPTAFSLTSHLLTVQQGQTAALTPSFTPTATTNKTVFWESLNDAIALVDAQGNVTGLTEGSTQVVAYSQAVGWRDTCLVTVTPGATTALTGIAFNNEFAELYPEQIQLAEVTFSPASATDKKLYFSSSNATIAGVSELGFIEGRIPGEAWIYARSRQGSYRDSILVKVINGLPQVSISQPADFYFITEGGNITLKADATDDIRVEKVEFYANNVLLSVSRVAPYQYVWSSPAKGFYELNAKASDEHGGVSWSQTVHVRVYSTQGMDELNENRLTVFPNPASEHLNFAFDLTRPASLEITIFSVAGVQMLHEKFDHCNTGQQQLAIDIAPLHEGLYFYTVKAGDNPQLINGKFVKTK